MIFPSKIDERAAKLRAGIPPPHKPPAQDYANLIEHRRRSRVAENRQMEEGIAYDNGIQKRVQLINAANERHRLEGYYRLGQVPSHILHPLIKGLTKPVVKMEVDSSSDEDDSAAMEIDAGANVEVIDTNTGCVLEMGKRGNDGVTPVRGNTNRDNLKNKLPDTYRERDYTPGETDVARNTQRGVDARAAHPEDIVTRNAKTRTRNKISAEAFAAAPARRRRVARVR